jgi:hypothetical protein
MAHTESVKLHPFGTAGSTPVPPTSNTMHVLYCRTYRRENIVINLDKEWHDLTVDEKLDELSHAMSAVVSMAMDFEARMLDVARSGKLLSESMLVMNRAGQKDEQRITSLERRVDAMTNGTKTETIWSRN